MQFKCNVNIYKIYNTFLPDVSRDEAIPLEDHVPKMDPGKAQMKFALGMGFYLILHIGNSLTAKKKERTLFINHWEQMWLRSVFHYLCMC